RGLPTPGDDTVDVAPVGRPVRRHEGLRCQAPQGARGRERPVEEAARRGRARQVDAQGARGGKLLTPNRKRAAAEKLRERSGVSDRRACKLGGQHRSTQRLAPPPISDEERRLREFLRDFSKRRPRWGWRRAAKAARKAGWQVNDKRVRRL